MRFLDPGVVVECDARTQVLLICGHLGETEDTQRADEHSRATQPSVCESF